MHFQAKIVCSAAWKNLFLGSTKSAHFVSGTAINSSPWVREILLDSGARGRPIFMLEAMLKAHHTGQRNYTKMHKILTLK